MSDPTAPVPQNPQGPQPPVTSAAGAPTAGPGGAPYGAPAHRDGWFSQATSTAGGRVAVVAAAVFGTLLLMAGVGLVAVLVGGVGHGFGFGDDDERVMMSGRDGPGNGRGMGLGLGQDKNKDKDRGNQGNGRGNNGQGVGRLAAGIDGVLHGEFTTNVTGTPTVMVVQTGQVTAYTAGESLTVKSADGFEATYVVDAAVATMRGADDLAAGVQVQVVAAKEGMKLTRLSVE